MKTKLNVMRVSAFVIAMSLLVGMFRGQETPFASLKQAAPFSYCCLAYKGPISDIGTVIGKFIQGMQGQNLFPTVRGPMIGVYYSSPADTKPADMQWEVGFPVADGTAAKPPLVVKPWKYMSCAVCMHKGTYDKSGDTIQKLMSWINEKGLVVAGPVLERYLNTPIQAKPEDLLTEIWIPVTKK